MTVTLENSDAEQREIEIGESEQTTCPACGSTNIEFHRLNRVLAGECVACFETWTLGPLTDWEVLDG
jgi:protein-arginine kinase activator protein McsA